MGLESIAYGYTRSAADAKFISKADYVKGNYRRYTLVTTNITLSSNQKYGIDTTASSLTATLPASPTIGDIIEIFDISGKWSSGGTNNLIVSGNGNLVEQLSGGFECDVKYGIFRLVYVDTSFIGWKIIPTP